MAGHLTCLYKSGARMGGLKIQGILKLRSLKSYGPLYNFGHPLSSLNFRVVLVLDGLNIGFHCIIYTCGLLC